MDDDCLQLYEAIDGQMIHTELPKNALALSAEVQSTIEQVLSSDDPLDRPDFNLISYVNSVFPNEQSLSNIDDVLLNMKRKIQQLDEEIRGVVREQNEVESDGKLALQNATQVIRQLTKQIAEIKQNSRESERMVNDITGDIKQLDNAKRNLTSSIVMLNNLHILVEGVGKLEQAIDSRTYGQAAAVLQSLVGVLMHLERHRSNEHVQRMAAEVDAFKSKLSEQIMSDFEIVFEQSAGKPLSARHSSLLSDACLVIDSLGASTKHSFFNWIITLRLLSYATQFPDDGEQSWLDKVDKRYAF
jgi:chromosome segregation ATPase